MNKGFKTKYVALLAGLLIFLYIGYQVYQVSYHPIKCVTAGLETVYDSITKDAVFIRDEDVITSSKVGTMVYNVKDGTRVEKGGVIANVFSSESEADSYAQLNSVEKQIAYYENIVLQSNAGATSLEVIDANIQNDVNNYIRAVARGKTELADEYGATMIDDINNRKITIGESIDVNSVLNELYAKRKNLQANITGTDAVIAEQAGYFISSVSGAEGEVDYTKATELSVSNIENIIKKKIDADEKNAVGKVIKSFDWYIALVVKDDEILGLEENSVVTVKFSQAEVDELKATVVAINQDSENAHKVAFILKLDNMDENIAKIRSGKVEIRFNQYEGLKIPNDALRAVSVKDKKTGKELTRKCVYVLSGNIVKKKYVEVVYNGEDFVLAKSNTSQTGYVRLYDRVIIKGENLEDNKVVKYSAAN